MSATAPTTSAKVFVPSAFDVDAPEQNGLSKSQNVEMEPLDEVRKRRKSKPCRQRWVLLEKSVD